MNEKKANWAFLIEVFGYMVLAYGLALFLPRIMGNIVLNNLLCEVIMSLPVLVFMVASGEKPVSFLGFHKMKISSVLMTVLFTFLSMPVLTLFNLISQLWVENEVASMMEEMQMGEMPLGALLFSMSVSAPVFEEITCRGAYYRAYKKSGSALKAMLMSSLIFAVSHMNFNQAAYAFAVGILAVLLVEATGSLWSSILYHAVINGSQVILMYQMLKVNPNIYSEQADLVTSDFLIYGIGAYLLITAVTLPLAWAVLIWLSGNEGRSGVLSGIWHGRKKKDKIITPLSMKAAPSMTAAPSKKAAPLTTAAPFILALLLALGVMTGLFTRLFIQIYQYCFQYWG